MGPEVEGEAEGLDVPPRGRVRVALGIGAGLAALALGAGWIERRPIVEHFAGRMLGDAHVPASYRIAAIGPFAQRLEDVRLGDPSAPDLTARVIELHLGYGLTGPHLVAVRAEGVRLAARVVDGKVSLGAIDRLLPKTSSTAPLALPDMAVTLADTQVALATPAGAITADITGSGNLADGFRGTLAARAAALRTGGCVALRPAARLELRIAARRPVVRGPIDLAGLDCPGVTAGAGQASVDLAFAQSLDRWQGDVALAGFAGAGGGARFGALSGRIGVTGSAARMTGTVALASAGVAAPAGRAERAALSGNYRYRADTGFVFAGDVALDHAALDAARRRQLIDSGGALTGTPIGPLAARALAATDALLGDANGHATVALTAGNPSGTLARIRTLDLNGGGGGHVRLGGGNGIGWTAKGWRVDTRLTSGGGDLPAFDILLAQRVAGGPLSGVARMAPYAVDGARLAITPARFQHAPDGSTRFDTVATLDGPLAGGRIEGLTVPLAGRVDARGFVLGEGCVAVGLHSLSLSGVVLDPARLRVCGIGGAPIVASGGGTVRAGVTLADAHLTGRSGAAPLDVSAKAARLAASGIAVDGLAVTLGQAEAQTRLDVATLVGAARDGGFAGTFADAAGQIGHVPLALSGAAGDWRVAGGALTLSGALTVADADPTPRFLPLAGRDVALRLAGGRIEATGTLHEPKSDALVANVAIRHDLATAAGGATLAVPKLAFDPKGLQPEALTPLTLGVIANVAGVAKGEGRIDWTAQGVTSSGDFATDGIDLAAAFGPVKKIAGRIHFSDLLGMVSPRGQEVTIAEINPGIAVSEGVVHYHLLGPNRFEVEDARWPFAGGTLVLDHSLLAFGLATERHLTFRVAGLDAAAFVQQLDFPNVAATGTFDGTLPMIFDDSGGRIAGGLLTARNGGGTLAYVGELTNAQLGTMGKLAFDALKAIRYKSLSIGLDGKLDGEIVSMVKFEGVRQATGDAGFVARMIYNLPFRFNIAIRAPFRGLMGSARTYADPNLLLNAGLLTTTAPTSAPPAASPAPAPPSAAIQRPESETMR